MEVLIAAALLRNISYKANIERREEEIKKLIAGINNAAKDGRTKYVSMIQYTDKKDLPDFEKQGYKVVFGYGPKAEGYELSVNWVGENEA